jgi:hypothetical protein
MLALRVDLAAAKAGFSLNAKKSPGSFGVIRG